MENSYVSWDGINGSRNILDITCVSAVAKQRTSDGGHCGCGYPDGYLCDAHNYLAERNDRRSGDRRSDWLAKWELDSELLASRNRPLPMPEPLVGVDDTSSTRTKFTIQHIRDMVELAAKCRFKFPLHLWISKRQAADITYEDVPDVVRLHISG